MRLTIVRHANAGQKRRWKGDDLERPLAPRGERQVTTLTRLLSEHPVRRVISSPALRCIQTIQATASRNLVDVETDDELGPDGSVTWIIERLTDPEFDDAVLCTHGELMGELLFVESIRSEMRRQKAGRACLLEKGSAWRLHVNVDGEVTKLRHLRTHS